MALVPISGGTNVLPAMVQNHNYFSKQNTRLCPGDSTIPSLILLSCMAYLFFGIVNMLYMLDVLDVLNASNTKCFSGFTEKFFHAGGM